MSTLFNILKRSPEGDAGGQQSDAQISTQEAIAAQIAALKNDMTAQQASMIASTQETLMNSVRGMIESSQRAIQASPVESANILDDAPEEFKEEMEAIGVDASQMNGLLKTMQKFVDKHVPKIKHDIKREVNGWDAVSIIAPFGFVIRLYWVNSKSRGKTLSHLQAVVP